MVWTSDVSPTEMGEQSQEAQGPAGANSQLSLSGSVPLDNLNFSEHISSFKKKRDKNTFFIGFL